MQKTTYLVIGLTTCLVTVLGYVAISLGTGGWKPGDVDETFEYMTKPVALPIDKTEASEILVEFTKREFLTKEVKKVDDNIYVAIGWALANCIMIEGDDGIIIVDTTESSDSMKEIMVEFRKITTKPVKAIIFTHFHVDHNTGTLFIIEEERKVHPNNTVEIYAHELTKELMFGFSDTYDIGFKRGLRQVGVMIPMIYGSQMPLPLTGSGLGPFLRLDTSTNLAIPTPTVTFSESATYTIAGVEVELLHTPGETTDQCTVWLPKQRAILPGDNIYKTFPNLYAIRGSPARDSKQWYMSLDRLRTLGGQYLIGSHTQPVIGEAAVEDALLTYRDGIKFVHDQTVRLMNKGYYPGQIVEEIKLPDKLAKHPHLQEHYGTVPWSVRGVFANYLGWFSGDPKDLDAMPESDRAERMARLVAYAQIRNTNPVEVILQEAQISHQTSRKQYDLIGKHISSDDKWAVELADNVLELAKKEAWKPFINETMVKVAKTIKTSALTSIGVEHISPNGRNYFLTNAIETQFGIDIKRTKSAQAFAIHDAPVDRVAGMFCAKVDGLECQNKNYAIAFTFPDVGKKLTVTLRNSVCDVIESLPADADVHLQTDSDTFKSIQAEELDLDTEIGLGTVEVVSGNLAAYKEFLACFEPIILV